MYWKSQSLKTFDDWSCVLDIQGGASTAVHLILILTMVAFNTHDHVIQLRIVTL